ncbi:MAG: redoxin domain-containing protein [candidate division Zixibacteria bacterium]|nr:redoxin domain-containing protein [candidate division Zixibacteria bacterium]
MKRVLTIVCSFLMLFTVTACAEKHSLKSFNKSYDNLKTITSAISLCREYMEQIEDIDELRHIQDEWKGLDPEGLRAYSKSKLDNSPKSKLFKYLYGRVVESPVESIRIGREIIKDYPDWAYGYRLVLETYDSYINEPIEGEKLSDSLKIMIDQDAQYYQTLIRLQPDDAGVLHMYYLYQMFKTDYKGALETADRYRKQGGQLIHAIYYANLLIYNGDYDVAKVVLRNRLKENGVEKERFEEEFFDDYSLALYHYCGAYQEFIRFVNSRKTHDELSSYRCYWLAVAHTKLNNKDSALFYLEYSAERGISIFTSNEEDTIFTDYHQDSRWNNIINTFRENRISKEAKEKQSIISEKIKVKAPGWTLEDADGNEVSLSSLRGKIVVIDFWAEWCQPCCEALPYVSKFAANQDSSKVQVLAIKVMTNTKNRVKYRALFENNEYAMTLLFGDINVNRDYEINGVPYLVVIDQEGYIRYQKFGFGGDDSIRKLTIKVEDLL